MKSILLIISVLMFTSCSSITRLQKEDLVNWKADGNYVKEKDPTTAAFLAILPGVGNFYNGEVGLGIVNLVFWPASVLWAPMGAYEGAQLVNWEQSKINALRKNKNATVLGQPAGSRSTATQNGSILMQSGNAAQQAGTAAGNHLMHHTPPPAGF